MADPKEPLAVVMDNTGGIVYYVLHIWDLLARHYRLRALTFASGTPDPILKERLPGSAALLDEDRPESIDNTLRLLKSEGFGLLHMQMGARVHALAPFFIEFLTSARRQRAKVVMTLHNVLPMSHSIACLDDIRTLYQHADGFLVGNEPERRKLCEHFDIGGRPVAIAPHGPYTGLNRRRYSQSSARKLLGLPPHVPVVLFFGGMRREKGLECLCAAWPRVRERIPEAVMLLSVMSRLHPEWLDSLDQLIRPIRDQGVILRKGYAPWELVEPIFQACNLVALPYLKVTQSGVLAAARAFQRPVVVTDIFDRAAEMEGAEGRVVPPNDAEALAEALVAILMLPPRQQQAMGARGLRYALTNESWEMNVEALREISPRLAHQEEAIAV